MKCRGHSPVQGDEKEDDDDDDDGCCVCVCKNDTSGTTDDKDRKSSAFGGSAVKSGRDSKNLQPMFCIHFSMLFCELMYRCTSSGSPTMSFPLYITPPFDPPPPLRLTGAVLLLEGTPGLELTGDVAPGLLVVGDLRGDGE